MGSGTDEPTESDLRRILDVARATANALGATVDEADDCAQTAATKLYLKWDSECVQKARVAGSPRWDAYVRRVAHNTHLDLIRSHQRRVARQVKAAGHNIPIVDDDGSVSAPVSPSGVDSYMARAAIAEIIMSLPPKQRAVAMLICIDEMSVREAADDLGIQPQSVRKQMRMARTAIRSALQGNFESQSSGRP